MFLNPPSWPRGMRCAASVTFDVDADALIKSARPGETDLYLQPLTMGRYGPTVAVPRILESFRRFGIRQTFFIPGCVMRDYPAMVEAVLRDGHEIAHHSWCHENPLEHGDGREAELFEKALEVHVSMTGRKPRGYRAPFYSMTVATLDRLIENGFLYDSTLMADDLPYLVRRPSGSLIEIPPHWGTDDWPPFAHFEQIDYVMPIRAPSDGIRAVSEEFEAMHEAGGLWMPVLHPFLMGRLARWREFERRMEAILAQGDVWFAPLEEIAAHSAERADSLRVDDL